jgi:glycyl-tRNA synthetase
VADKADLVMDLAKRRGFLWPSFEVYGGAAGFYDYGPLGAVMKRRFEDLWRRIFVLDEATPMAEIFCPRVTISEVLEASGHVAEFTDVVVKCAKGHPSRADHLVAAAGFKGNAATLSPTDLDAQIAALKAKCPACGETKFSPAARQNLMNQTEIGPGSGRVGFLRPETAQGIFTDFPLLFRHFRERLPFGVVQVGGSNRNEISPRQGMLRLREFSMMEAEIFYDPARKTHPKFSEVAGRDATFVPNSDEKDHRTTFGKAVASGMVANEALAYWLARTQEFLLAAGMDPSRLRFRQHLKTEMAHYAADCWDAEFHSERYGWVECVGVADRGNYDLTQHAKKSGANGALNPEFLRYTSGAPVAFRTTSFAPSKKFFPTLKQNAKPALAALEQESPYAKAAAAHGLDASSWATRAERFLITEKEGARKPSTSAAVVRVGGSAVEIPADCLDVLELEVTVQGRRTIPHVIEPSFGVDRILYALWEHAYEAGEKNGEPYVRLRLGVKVAPIHAAILPLMAKDGLDERAHRIEMDLRAAGFLTDYDEAGSIGRRYARQDEVGTPFCITIDTETPRDGKVTVRDRDSTEQERVSVHDLVQHLRSRIS